MFLFHRAPRGDFFCLVM